MQYEDSWTKISEYLASKYHITNDAQFQILMEEHDKDIKTFVLQELYNKMVRHKTEMNEIIKEMLANPDEQRRTLNYWVEDSYYHGPQGWDYVCIGRISDKTQTERDGDNWLGSHDRYAYDCYETLEQALCNISIRPSALLYHSSLTTEDLKYIRAYVKENDEIWAKRENCPIIKNIVHMVVEDPNFSQYIITVPSTYIDKKNKYSTVMVTFDKKRNTLTLANRIFGNQYELIDIFSNDYERLVTYVCESTYQYCHLYTDMDMRHFYTMNIKNIYLKELSAILKDNECQKDIDER